MGLIDFIFPQSIKCIVCEVETLTGICDECKKSLPWIKGEVCICCGGRLLPQQIMCNDCQYITNIFEKCYCVFDYTGIIRIKLLECKQDGKKHAVSAFTDMLYDKYMEINKNFDIILTVPTHKSKLKERGYNHVDLLASTIVSRTNKVRSGVLIKVKKTPRQAGLDRENRQDNIKDAFKVVDRKAVKGKDILLIDDIYTTGSTINECSRVLKNAGAKSITALCLCRTPINVKILDA